MTKDLSASAGAVVVAVIHVHGRVVGAEEWGPSRNCTHLNHKSNQAEGYFCFFMQIDYPRHPQPRRVLLLHERDYLPSACPEERSPWAELESNAGVREPCRRVMCWAHSEGRFPSRTQEIREEGCISQEGESGLETVVLKDREAEGWGGIQGAVAESRWRAGVDDGFRHAQWPRGQRRASQCQRPRAKPYGDENGVGFIGIVRFK